MSIHEKQLAKMRNNPKNWQMADILVIAERYGVEVRNHGGSHHIFSFPGIPLKPCVPAHRPIKPVYIKQFLLLLDQISQMRG